MLSRYMWQAFAGVMVLFASLLPLRGQVTTASYYCIVTDNSGAVIPGATVTITHDRTGAVASRATDQQGEVGFTFLIVGAYRLRIEAQGFKSNQAEGIALTAGQQVRRTFVMELGAITETVNVQAAAPLVNAVSAEQNQTFESVKVTELPLARRNVSNILGIGTGVSRSTTQHGTLRLNGLGQGGTGISLDGTEASGNPEGRSAGMFQNFNQIDLVSIDAVQEVQVIKGVAQAEYGRAVGGQINVITRSGTNEFHGSLFENFQAENLNARNQTLPTKPGATFNQFGASAGGRVVRDRIFFFAAYEGYRDASFRVVSGDMPTPRTRAEVLAAVPAYNLALRILPLPNQPYAAEAVTGFYKSAATFRGR
ncbi:MAG: TonB-dependent receptor, partial [Bryobacterales bacterium]|nr:TonB-dependent receptor [Bryobacterales bacterium]